jgi:ubiquinone/menaquinone biosynthesis C-methylase UbiE
MQSTALKEALGPRYEVVSHDADLALEALALPPRAAVLDVGTGSGHFAIYLAAQGHRVITGEPSTDESRYARRDWAEKAEHAGVLSHIRFESFDASRLPFPADEFDAVCFFGVLHHVAEDMRCEAVREAFRVCKTGGVVVFFEPNRAMLEKLWQEDPAHPLAATPSQYLADADVREQRIAGKFMDISIFRKPGN